MAVKVPAQNKRAFEDVMKALGGDDYAYYLFDVTKIEQPDSKEEGADCTQGLSSSGKKGNCYIKYQWCTTESRL